ncbi:unnamed protein product, partial [Allacma fusca]
STTIVIILDASKAGGRESLIWIFGTAAGIVIDQIVGLYIFTCDKFNEGRIWDNFGSSFDSKDNNRELKRTTEIPTGTTFERAGEVFVDVFIVNLRPFLINNVELLEERNFEKFGVIGEVIEEKNVTNSMSGQH